MLKRFLRWPWVIAACTMAFTLLLAVLYAGCVKLPGTLLGAAVCAGGCFLCVTAQKKQWPAPRLFLCLFVPLSLCMLLAMPIGRVPDEDSHLQRIWLLSEGQLSPTGLTEPEGLLEGISDTDTTHAMLASMRGSAISEQRVASDAGFNTGVYPPISYAPQALAVALVRLFTGNRLVLLYAARLGGWLATVLLLYAAIRLLPRGKYGLIAIALMPVMLQEGMSASVDGMAFGAVSLLTAWVLRAREQGTRLTLWDGVRLTMLCILTVSCKMIYAPFLLLAAAIPSDLWGSRGRKAAALCGAWGVTLALTAGWIIFCYVRYVSGQTMSEAAGLGTIMPQLTDVLTHPFHFMGVLLSTLKSRLVIWLHTMLGSGLSALNISVALPVLLCEAAGLLLVWLTDDALPRQGFGCPRGLMIGCGVLSLLVMLVSLYCWWNPYQATIIEGMQGRYLIPMVMPALLAVRLRGKDGTALRLPDAGPAGALMLMLCLPAAIASILRVWDACL